MRIAFPSISDISDDIDIFIFPYFYSADMADENMKKKCKVYMYATFWHFYAPYLWYNNHDEIDKIPN